MKKIILTNSFLLFLFLCLQNIFASTCEPESSIGFDLENSSYVFTGKVISSRKINSRNEYSREYYLNGKLMIEREKEIVYKFEVFEILKGRQNLKYLDITVSNVRSGFEINETYLVFADGKNEKNLRSRTSCGYSKSLTRSEDKIYFIKKFISGVKEPQVYGMVSYHEVDNLTGKYKRVFVPNVQVIISGENRSYEAVTNNEGVYEFNDIPKGLYRIFILPPMKPEKLNYHQSTLDNKFVVLPNKMIIRERDVVDYPNNYDWDKLAAQSTPYNQKGYFQSFYLWRDNEVTGKIIDANEKELKLAEVEVVPVNNPFIPLYLSNYSNKLYDSNYQVINNPPGQYLLAFEVNSSTKDGKRQRFFYPAATNPKEAKVFNISASDKLTIDIKVPLNTRELQGKMLWSDGTPIKGNVNVYLSKDYDVEDLVFDNLGESDLNEANRFTFQVFEHNEYWLHFEIEAESNKPDANSSDDIIIKVKPVKIKIGKADEYVKILVPKPRILLNH